jgi:hypothetical protein
LWQDITTVTKVSDKNGWGSGGGVAKGTFDGGKDEVASGRGIRVSLADMKNLVSRSCSPEWDSLPVVVPEPVLIVVKE